MRGQYVVASVPAALTRLWKRSFYLPLVAVAATPAILWYAMR